MTSVRPLTLLFFSLSFITSLQTQPNNFELRGTVTDRNDATLSLASVTLNNLTTGLERIVVTNSTGGFLFPATRSGNYKLTVTATGFDATSQVIEVSGDVSLDFKLEIAGLTDPITVVSGSRQEELRESLNTKVDVIGRNRIRDSGYESIAEISRELPGVLTRRAWLPAILAACNLTAHTPLTNRHQHQGNIRLS